jgi:hypothetical protein
MNTEIIVFNVRNMGNCVNKLSEKWRIFGAMVTVHTAISRHENVKYFE